MLELVNINKNYGKLIAVNNININIIKDTIHGLIGPNGSGKTTLFNLISGFIKIDKGNIMFCKERIDGYKPYKIAKKGIIRTFQHTNIYPDMTVLQNVMMCSHLSFNKGLINIFKRNQKAQKYKIIQKAIKKLEIMGIENISNQIAGKLPGGTQKILAISNALAAEPKLLMLDEPLAGLNNVEKKLVMSRLKKLKDIGITIFIVEHDIKSIMNSCDKITVINFGVKIAEGTPNEISNDEKTIKAYLGRSDGDI